jgi:hypothetical protein
VSRSGKLIPMDPVTTQDQNAGKAIGARTVIIVLGALLFTLHSMGSRLLLTRVVPLSKRDLE